MVEVLPSALATVMRDYPMVYAVAEECRRRHSGGRREFAADCASGEGEGLNLQVSPGTWVEVPADTALASRMILIRSAGAGRRGDGSAAADYGQVGGYRIRGYDPDGQPLAAFATAAAGVDADGNPATNPVGAAEVPEADAQEPGAIGRDGVLWVLVDNEAGTAEVAHAAYAFDDGGTAVQASAFFVEYDFGDPELQELVVFPLGYAGLEGSARFQDGQGLEVIFLHPDEEAGDFREHLAAGLGSPGALGAIEYEFSDAVRAVTSTPVTLFPGGQYQRLDGEAARGRALATVAAGTTVEVAPAVLFRDGEVDFGRLFENGAWYGMRDLTGFRPVAEGSPALAVDLDGQPVYGYDYRGLPFASPSPTLFREEAEPVFLDLAQELVMSPGYSWSGIIAGQAAVTLGLMAEAPDRTQTAFANSPSLFIRSYPDVDRIGPATIEVASTATVTGSVFPFLVSLVTTTVTATVSVDPLHGVGGYAADESGYNLDFGGWRFEQAAATLTLHLTSNAPRSFAPGERLPYDETRSADGVDGVPGGVDGHRALALAYREYTVAYEAEPFAEAVVLTLPARIVDVDASGTATVDIGGFQPNPLTFRYDDPAMPYEDVVLYDPQLPYRVAQTMVMRPKTSTVPNFSGAGAGAGGSGRTGGANLPTAVALAGTVTVAATAFAPATYPYGDRQSSWPEYVAAVPDPQTNFRSNFPSGEQIYGRFESEFAYLGPPVVLITETEIQRLGYAYGRYSLDYDSAPTVAAEPNHLNLSGHDAPFFGLGGDGTLPAAGATVGASIRVTATFAAQATVVRALNPPDGFDAVYAPAQWTGVTIDLGRGASFSLNRTSRIVSTLRFGDDFRIDGYAAVWPRYDRAVQAGWGFPAFAGDRGQQLYFERLSAGFAGGTPDGVWLVMPEPVRAMRRDDGSTVSVYAGSMINPVSGEVRLARPFPAAAAVTLGAGADAAVEGNYADRRRPIQFHFEADVATLSIFLYPEHVDRTMVTAGVTLAGGDGDLCYVPHETLPSTPRANDFSYETLPAFTGRRACIAQFDDLVLSLEEPQSSDLGGALIGAIEGFSPVFPVMWDELASESWLLFDAAASGVERNELVSYPPRGLNDLLWRSGGAFLRPVRNVSNFRLPPGAAVPMPAFRQAAPTDIGFVFPPGSAMEAAAPDPGSDSAAVRTDAVDVGGAGVPSVVRTPGSSIGVQVSLSLGFAPVVQTMTVAMGSVWDPAVTLGAEFEFDPADGEGVRADMYFPKYYGVSLDATTTAAVEATVSFEPVETTMIVDAPRRADSLGVPPEFHGLRIRQNVWISVGEDAAAVYFAGMEAVTLHLPRGTILNPMFGTYLLPPARLETAQGAPERLETRARMYVSPAGADLELTRPALTVPAGARLYAARGAALRNVQAAVFFSPYPLEAAADCAVLRNNRAPLGADTDDSGFRLSQLDEGLFLGNPRRTYDPLSAGHICALLDTEENTDFDDWYALHRAPQRPAGARDRRIEINDRVYPVGGRLAGAFPSPTLTVAGFTEPPAPIPPPPPPPPPVTTTIRIVHRGDLADHPLTLSIPATPPGIVAIAAGAVADATFTGGSFPPVGQRDGLNDLVAFCDDILPLASFPTANPPNWRDPYDQFEAPPSTTGPLGSAGLASACTGAVPGPSFTGPFALRTFGEDPAAFRIQAGHLNFVYQLLPPVRTTLSLVRSAYNSPHNVTLDIPAPPPPGAPGATVAISVSSDGMETPDGAFRPGLDALAALCTDPRFADFDAFTGGSDVPDGSCNAVFNAPFLGTFALYPQIPADPALLTIQAGNQFFVYQIGSPPPPVLTTIEVLWTGVGFRAEEYTLTVDIPSPPPGTVEIAVDVTLGQILRGRPRQGLHDLVAGCDGILPASAFPNPPWSGSTSGPYDQFQAASTVTASTGDTGLDGLCTGTVPAPVSGTFAWQVLYAGVGDGPQLAIQAGNQFFIYQLVTMLTPPPPPPPGTMTLSLPASTAGSTISITMSLSLPVPPAGTVTISIARTGDGLIWGDRNEAQIGVLSDLIAFCDPPIGSAFPTFNSTLQKFMSSNTGNGGRSGSCTGEVTGALDGEFELRRGDNDSDDSWTVAIGDQVFIWEP